MWRDGSLVATIDLPNTPRYSDNGLAPASTHSYVFKAVDSAKNVSVGTTAKSVKTLAAGAVAIARGPYLSNVTGTSGVVSWWTNIATTGSVALGGQTVVDPVGTVQHHQVSVAGLSPNTAYPYTVTSNGTSASGTLQTAATPGTTFSFAAIGDFGGGAGGETLNANNIATSGSQFIQTVGDNVYPSSGFPDPDFTTVYSDFDQRLLKPFATAMKSQSFFPANGNKEYYANGEFWSAFPMPGTNHSWYSYDWGSAHILVLDSEQDYATGSEQYNFAMSDLAAHQDAIWRIVAIQRPPYSSTSASSSSTGVQQYLVPLFQQQHVQLVLSGNSHNYERTYPLTNGVPSANGITYVVTGAGGNGFNAFSGTPTAYSAFRESSYYEFVKVTVSPTALTADAIRADTNAVVDSTTITPSAGGGDTVAPSVPGGVVATASGSSTIDVVWNASVDDVGVAGYRVFRDGAATAVATVLGTSFSDTGLSAGSTHSYTVSAFDAAGNASAMSVAASATTAGGGGSTVTVAPSGDATVSSAAGKADTNYGKLTTLTVDADGSISDFLVSFVVPSTCAPTAAVLSLTVAGGSSNNSANGGDFYAAPGVWNETTVTATNAPVRVGSAVHTGAVALNATYQIDVGSLISSAISNGVFSLRATTPSNDAAVYVSKNASNAATAGPKLQLTCNAAGGDTVAPSVPGGVVATASGSSTIDVVWNASVDDVGVAGYRVFRDGAATAVATVLGTSFSDTGLSAGSTHSYTVSAFDAAGNASAMSVAASATTAGGGGSTVTVAPSGDATVSSAAGKADTNYGKLTTLTVDADGSISDFLVSFVVPSTCAPTAAVLSLTVAGGSSNNSANGGDFYAAPGVWNETTVTATNAPVRVGSAVHTGAVALNVTYQIDVGSLLSSAISNGVFSLRATTPSTDAAVYVSKNATNGATAGPKLQLTCS